MFRRGGMPSSEGVAAIRPKYMGGGMSGIMTGINPTAGLTPRVGYQEGTTFTRGGGVMQGGSYSTRGVPVRLPATLAQVPAVIPQGPPTASMRWPWLSEKGLLEAGKKIAGKGAGIASGFAQRFPKFGVPYAAPISALALKSSMIKPTETEKEYGVKDWEKILASSLPGTGGERLPLIIRNALGLKKKNKKELDPLDKIGGEKEIKDEESALMKAYKEYAPIFEKELGVSDDDTKKQLYLQLAKFGAGVAAQPGGDLVGAIGKAALPAIEGAGETVKEQSTAKRQAKLLALQTAISEGKPGPIATAIKDIAKIYKVSNKEAAAIYEKWNVKNSAGNPAQEKRLETLATKIDVNPDGFIRNINKLLKSEDADLIGKFNKKLPMDKSGIPDPDSAVDKEYYIGLGGELYRVDKSVEPAALLEPGDAGFKDSKKEK